MGGNSNHSQRIYSANPADYKLLEEVGYGASATVYRAIYLPLNDVVAIKCLDLDRCNSNLVSSLSLSPPPLFNHLRSSSIHIGTNFHFHYNRKL